MRAPCVLVSAIGLAVCGCGMSGLGPEWDAQGCPDFEFRYTKYSSHQEGLEILAEESFGRAEIQSFFRGTTEEMAGHYDSGESPRDVDFTRRLIPSFHVRLSMSGRTKHKKLQRFKGQLVREKQGRIRSYKVYIPLARRIELRVGSESLEISDAGFVDHTSVWQLPMESLPPSVVDALDLLTDCM